MKSFLVFFLLIIPGMAYATDRYVSPGGTDSGAGPIGSPWLTISYATGHVVAGDTIYVRAGTYNEKFSFTVTGTAGNPITLRNYPGESVIVSGAGIPMNSWDALCGLYNKSYIIVDGIHFTNCQGTHANENTIGWNGGSYNTLQNCEVSYHTGGIAVMLGSDQASDHFTAYNDYVHNVTTNAYEAVRFDDNSSYFKGVSLTVKYTTNIGIDVVGWGNQPTYGLIQGCTVGPDVGYSTDGAHGIYLDGACNTVVQNNDMYGWCDGGIQIAAEHVGITARNNIVRFNIVKNGKSKGLTLGGSQITDGGYVQDSVMVHNTAIDNTGNAYSQQARINFQTGTNVFKNNLLYSSGGITDRYMIYRNVTSTPENLISDYNCLYPPSCHYVWSNVNELSGFSAWQATSLLDSHSIALNPLFATTTTYTLSASSPCVDAGDYLTTTNGSGSGTVITVNDSRFFTDGFSGLFPADTIQFSNGRTAKITAVNYGANQLTVSASLTWSDGLGVSYPFGGKKPDIGYSEFIPVKKATVGRLTKLSFNKRFYPWWP